MTKELELEAEKYSSFENDYVPLVGGKYNFNEGYKKTFIAGATSDVAKKYWYKQFKKEL